MRPVSLPKWPHPLAGTTLPGRGRLARASALLLMRGKKNTRMREGQAATGGNNVRSRKLWLERHNRPPRFRFVRLRKSVAPGR